MPHLKAFWKLIVAEKSKKNPSNCIAMTSLCNTRTKNRQGLVSITVLSSVIWKSANQLGNTSTPQTLNYPKDYGRGDALCMDDYFTSIMTPPPAFSVRSLPTVLQPM